MSDARRRPVWHHGCSAALMLALAAGTAHAADQNQGAQPVNPPAPGGSDGPRTFTKSGSGETKSAKPAQAGDPGKAPEPPGSMGLNAGFLEQLMGGAQDTVPDGPDPSDIAADQANATPQGVKVSEFMTVDIFVQDEDLANVLQMLSLQSKRNIVASRDVNARVTANLYGVTFYEALDAILHVNGYGYVERGNFVYVYTLEELKAIKAEERAVVSKVVHLNYLNANDAAEFVSPLLSEKGQIKTNGDVGNFNIPEDTPTGDEQFALAATLVIFDYPEHVAEIEALLKQLDTKPAQVLVEATILQTELNEANAFGVDFAFLNGVNFIDFMGDLGGALGAATGLNTGEFIPDGDAQAVVSSPGNTAGPGTLKISIFGDDIAVFIRALDEVSDVMILSNPKILALNRQPARVLVGRKIGYLNTTSTETATTQTVEFLDTGTMLTFRPFISQDGMIRLELKPRVSEGIIRDIKDATGAAVTIPDEVTQELTTNVIVPDGSTVVLGGLFKETSKRTRRQVPLLGDIPIIGIAFRGLEDNTDRAEIMFLIKPTVMNDKVLIEQGDRALAYGDRVRAGSRQGLLLWSRERRTAQLNVKAEKLAAEGNKDEALWNLRRSLELSPSQPDAIRLQEALSGERDLWPSRSILEKVINGEAAVNAAAPINPPAKPTAQSPSKDASEPQSSAEGAASQDANAGATTSEAMSDASSAAAGAAMSHAGAPGAGSGLDDSALTCDIASPAPSAAKLADQSAKPAPSSSAAPAPSPENQPAPRETARGSTDEPLSSASFMIPDGPNIEQSLTPIEASSFGSCIPMPRNWFDGSTEAMTFGHDHLGTAVGFWWMARPWMRPAFIPTQDVQNPAITNVPTAEPDQDR